MANDLSLTGVWAKGSAGPAFDPTALLEAAARVREPAHVVRAHDRGRVGVAYGGRVMPSGYTNGGGTFPHLGSLPALYPEWLGDRSFCEAHGVRFPYVTGAMANGIATTRLVIDIGRAGMLGFFGAAGLSLARVEKAVDELIATLGDVYTWGANLIHSPNEPDLENAVADLYIRRGVRRVEAAAFMALTPAIVRYAYSGLTVDAHGSIHRARHVFAKVSRAEVARRFLAPAPREMLDALVQKGLLSAQEASLGARLPVAEDITVEADSGGHTDNQALSAVLPTILRLRDDMASTYGYARPIRVGAAGGLATPTAVAAAFQLGAAFVQTGSVNQASVQSGLDASGRKLLAQAGVADVVMAPAADMFEMGVKVQVLKRGTMFGPRAQRLYDAYQAYPSLEAMPAPVREKLEKEVLGERCETIWEGTRAFFAERDPREVERAERDPKHRMALVFRWYLGLSSKWAIAGEPSRKMDYQIWCGPAMGAFNDWVRGSFLEPPEARDAVQIALNLLEGAAVATRAHQLRCYGVPLPAAAFQFTPRPLAP